MDREQALNLIDELRVAVPEEVRAAKRINSEGERIIEKAQEEAERIVARAQEQAAFLIGERGLTEAAEAESRRIIADAEDDADNVRHGADEYAAGVLEMRGDSYPENSFELFSPVLDWIEAYLRDGDRPLTLNLQLLYLNTSSVKAMMLSPRL